MQRNQHQPEGRRALSTMIYLFGSMKRTGYATQHTLASSGGGSAAPWSPPSFFSGVKYFYGGPGTISTCHCCKRSQTSFTASLMRKTSPWDPTFLSPSNYRFDPLETLWKSTQALCPFFFLDREERYEIAIGSLILPTSTTFRRSLLHTRTLCHQSRRFLAEVFRAFADGQGLGTTMNRITMFANMNEMNHLTQENICTFSKMPPIFGLIWTGLPYQSAAGSPYLVNSCLISSAPPLQTRRR